VSISRCVNKTGTIQRMSVFPNLNLSLRASKMCIRLRRIALCREMFTHSRPWQQAEISVELHVPPALSSEKVLPIEIVEKEGGPLRRAVWAWCRRISCLCKYQNLASSNPKSGYFFLYLFSKTYNIRYLLHSRSFDFQILGNLFILPGKLNSEQCVRQSAPPAAPFPY